MRETLDSFDYGDATITIVFDTGGPVGSDHLVIVNGDDYLVNRWFYFDEFNQRYAENFAKKIVDDEAYRQASLDGTADWKQVAEIYEEAARRIFDIFQDAGLIGYRAGDEQEEQRYREAKDTWERLCREIFAEVKDRIRNDDSLDGLDEYIETRVEQARRKADDLAD
ncbi:hypothetical protein [Halospeciosus flavus]|uniref:Uncharacterized protein n=1 Tax=Halospeciosus flavus TaxID=3032283 RepID=A0ABD5Z6R9_9EURY|nr:hypothetical protein [Halospeciosus flavus]